MSVQKVLKGILLPSATATAATGGSCRSHALNCAKSECVCRPSELPVYPGDCATCKPKALERPTTDLEATIGTIRKELWVWQDEVHGYRQRVIDVCNTGISHASSTLETLREESNIPERYGAIAVASLAGFILGLRGGRFKRLTYATLGGVGMASLCYPRQAAEYSDIALQQGQHYFVAGYLFLFGDKPKTPEWIKTVKSIIYSEEKDLPKK